MRRSTTYRTTVVIGTVALFLALGAIPAPAGTLPGPYRSSDAADMLVTPRDSGPIIAVTGADFHPISIADDFAGVRIDPPKMRPHPHIRTGREDVRSAVPTHRFLATHHASSGL